MNEFVGVFGFSDGGQAEGSFLCLEQAVAGTLRIPATVLSSLPASSQDEDDNGLVLFGIPSREASQFGATGLDVGLFLYFDIVVLEGVNFE